MRGCQKVEDMKNAKKSSVSKFHLNLSLLLIMCAVSSAYGVSRPATTNLTVSPGTAVSAGTPITLSAMVLSEGTQRTNGMVEFCDLNVGCIEPTLLGKAWLTRKGTATLKVVLGVGTYNIVAVYRGSQSVPSSPQFVTVSGSSAYGSGVSISGTGNSGRYTLTARISAFGKSAPSGLLSFVNVSNGNSVIASTNLQSTAAQTSFVAPQSNGPVTGKGSYAMAVGDFNNDGYQDVAVVNSGDSTVSIALGKGNGSFGSSTVYRTGLAPVAVAVGDFNGDGFVDLAIANSADSTISVLLGNGDGTFKNQVAYALSSAPSSVAVSDVNLDGTPDIVATNNLGNCISVLFGLGDGTFEEPAAYPTGAGPAQVLIADVNGDGVPDVLTANTSDNTVSVLLGDGSGAFVNANSYTAGFEPHSIAAGDLNGDGNLDLVVANYGDNTISVMFGNGDGTFQPQSTMKVGSNPYQVVMGDFNQDGFLDVAVANALSNSVSVLLGSANGNLQSPSPYLVGSMPTALVSADLNGDGLPDLLVTSFGHARNANLSVLLGQQFLQMTAANVSVIGNGSQQIVAMYAGDALHTPSTSQAVVAQGLALATSVQIKSSLNPAPRNSKISFTAVVTSKSGIPTGSVTFFDGGQKLSTIKLGSSGQALLSVATLGLGKHAITVTYSGDSRFAAATSPALMETIQMPSAPGNHKTHRF